MWTEQCEVQVGGMCAVKCVIIDYDHRTMTFSLTFTDPCFLAFYTTTVYISPTFSWGMFLVTCFINS